MIADQAMRVEVLRLVGVILDADQVEAEIVEDLGDLEGAVGIAGRGIEEEAELQIVAVVSHGAPPGERRRQRDWRRSTSP